MDSPTPYDLTPPQGMAILPKVVDSFLRNDMSNNLTAVVANGYCVVAGAVKAAAARRVSR